MPIINDTKPVVFHRHHVVPRHMGGIDDPSNIEILSVDDHANAHKILFEKYGKLEDFVAWKCLSGKSSEVEFERIQLAKIGFEKFVADDSRVTPWKKKISESLTGKVHSKEANEKRSRSLKSSYKSGRRNFFKEQPKEFFVKHFIEDDMSEKMAEGRRKSEKWKNSVTSDEYRMKKSMADPRRKRVSVSGVEYSSVRQASKETGISLFKLRRLLDSRLQDDIFYI